MNDILELSLPVVGIHYANKDGINRRFAIGRCVPGDPVDLRREMTIKHNELAVAVFTSCGLQMGYLSAERAPWIAAKISADQGWQAVFLGLRPATCWIRIRFGGPHRTLPIRRDRPAARSNNFQPNPEGPRGPARYGEL